MQLPLRPPQRQLHQCGIGQLEVAEELLHLGPRPQDKRRACTAVDPNVVDRTMRSVSHPDVYAAGDCAYAIGENGRPLPMSCASAGFTTMQATAAIIARLTGSEVPTTRLKYYGNHISLGRRDAIFQMVNGDVRSTSWYLGGRTAARLKSGVLKGAGWSIAHPTFGMPKRKRRLATEPDRTGARVAA